MEHIDFLNTWTNEVFKFTIVDLITIFGIFIARYQQINPVFRFRMWYKWKKIYLFICAFLASIIWIIVVWLPWNSIWYLWYPWFRQMISLLFTICILLYLRYICTIPIKKVKNIKWLTKVITDSIWFWNKDLTAVGSEVQFFIENLVSNVDDWNIDAFDLLKILLDTSLIQNIILEQPLTLGVILRIYEQRKKINNREIDNLQEEFISTIVYESLNNNNSIIAREIRGNLFWGINQWKWLISQIIFENFEFIDKYDLLSRKWYPWSYKEESKSNIDYAKNYSNFREHATSSFFKDIPNNIKYYKNIYIGLSWFWWYNGILKENYKSYEITWKIFSQINFWIHEHNKEIKQYYEKWNIETIKIDPSYWIKHLQPNNLYEAISLGCYNLLESISYIKEENDWEIRDLIRQITVENYNTDISSIDNKINENLKTLMKFQILDKNIFWYYPNMTRIFFHIYWYEIFSNNIKKHNQEFCIQILKLLHTSLPKLYDWMFWWIQDNESVDEDLQINRNFKKEKLLWDLFPNYMFYNPNKHTLTYYFADKLSKSVLDLKQTEDDKIIILDKSDL